MQKKDLKVGIFGDEWGTNQWFTKQFNIQGAKDPSAYYGHSQNGYQVHRHSVLVSLLRNYKAQLYNSSVLDIGCGGGDLTNSIAKYLKTNKVLGLDFVEGVIDIAKLKYPNIDFSPITLKMHQVSENTYDLVIISEVLYYLSEAEREEYLTKILKILKPNGVVLFASALGERYFTVNSAKELISKYFKIEIIKTEYYGLYHLLTSPFHKIRLLLIYYNTGTKPCSDVSRKKYDQFVKYFKIPFVKFFTILLASLGCFLIKNKFLPKIVERITAAFSLKRKSATNISIVAVKSLKVEEAVESDLCSNTPKTTLI